MPRVTLTILLAAGCLCLVGVVAWWFSSPTEPRPHLNTKADKQPQGLPAPAAQNDLPTSTLELDSLAESSPLAADYQAVDPQQDGWTSEADHNDVKAQLHHLAEWFAHQGNPGTKPTSDEIELRTIVAAEFQCGSLFAKDQTDLLQEPGLTSSEAAGPLPHQPRYAGPAGLAEALRQWQSSLPTAARLRLEFKIFGIESADPQASEPSDSWVTSRSYVVLQATSPSRRAQSNAIWNCRWKRDENGLLLVSITIEDSQLTQTSSRWLTDRTAQLLSQEALEHFQPSTDYWAVRIEQQLGLYLHGWSGLAVGDVNADGLDDLFVCQAGGLPNRLFVQNPDGSAQEVSHAAGVDWLDRTSAALLVDFDNDGDQDLALSMDRLVLILENLGPQNQVQPEIAARSAQRPEVLIPFFEPRRVLQTAGQPYSLAAADYNNDRQTDLFVCCYNQSALAVQQGGLGVPVPYFDANNGAANHLFKNSGDWTFADATATCGIDQNNTRFSYAASWEDFDNDGDQDLYVANDFGRNNLYRNDAGRFLDIAAQAGVEDVGSGMSVSWGDYNNDGRFDLYVGNMFSAAGSRVTYQRRFKSAFGTPELKALQRLAKGNTLFENTTRLRQPASSRKALPGNPEGDQTAEDSQASSDPRSRRGASFADASSAAGVTMGRWAWSSNFLDINNDGWEDIFVANGFVTGLPQADDL